MAIPPLLTILMVFYKFFDNHGWSIGGVVKSIGRALTGCCRGCCRFLRRRIRNLFAWILSPCVPKLGLPPKLGAGSLRKVAPQNFAPHTSADHKSAVRSAEDDTQSALAAPLRSTAAPPRRVSFHRAPSPSPPSSPPSINDNGRDPEDPPPSPSLHEWQFLPSRAAPLQEGESTLAGATRRADLHVDSLESSGDSDGADVPNADFRLVPPGAAGEQTIAVGDALEP